MVVIYRNRRVWGDICLEEECIGALGPTRVGDWGRSHTVRLCMKTGVWFWRPKGAVDRNWEHQNQNRKMDRRVGLG